METLLRYRSLVREAEALRSGADDPVAAALRTCDRIDAVDARVRAFVPEAARRTRLAEAARERVAAGPREAGDRPPLYGIPVGLKDIVHADGLPTRAGSALPPEVLGGAQATVVDRLLAAGALIAGKTVTADLTHTGKSVMCLPWSNAGLPSLSLPAGRAANGLPLGLQVVGAQGADEQLLQAAAGLESTLAKGDIRAHR
ncbi:amidase family protein [Streptomyces chattanoogensis]|uniref:Amidase domain-containing protein n=1 Tax=Streptomyces chattanoogensis TaxID=66876 RepID=A0A0N0H402_9ACTN|nr:amidase family protein [Streptomyces chattanoogensis]KPC66702.1 hypothetical protein ADL29_00380 [Streptomyces chattanoogensis]